MSSRVHEAVKAIALCHNVTPVYESRASATAETEPAEAERDLGDESRAYQASSPDEVSQPRGQHLGVSPRFLGLKGVSTSPRWGVNGGGGARPPRPRLGPGGGSSSRRHCPELWAACAQPESSSHWCQGPRMALISRRTVSFARSSPGTFTSIYTLCICFRRG